MKINLFGIKLDPLSQDEAREKFVSLVENSKQTSIIATVNLEFVWNALHDPDFKQVLNTKTKINSVDGAGIILNYGLVNAWRPKTPVIKQIYVFFQWFLAYLFFPISIAIYRNFIPGTIAGSDFIWDIAKISAQNNYRIFLLGYSKGLDPNVVEKASLKLQTDINDLKVAGVYSSTDSIADEKKIIEVVKKSSADILLVGFVSPRQEKWLAKNLAKTGCKVGVGVGGTFDFIAGVQKRAPRWMSKIGIEWLYRLIRSPKRIKRQMALPKIALKVLVERIK
ncbi:MAG: WecB/TagA/CpsF family glycosyltransferase [Patescibacteria group bacterium]